MHYKTKVARSSCGKMQLQDYLNGIENTTLRPVLLTLNYRSRFSELSQEFWTVITVYNIMVV